MAIPHQPSFLLFPWAEAYANAREVALELDVGRWSFAVPLHAIVDDGLMTIFFFVVGLEIRRELHAGELADRQRAMLPAAAALGGMLVPALLYVAFNPDGPARRGWGIPMATDIAFAVGVLTLLGSRAPAVIRVLLLAIAILDDIGGVIVIAVFYSGGLGQRGLVVAIIAVVVILAFQGNKVRHPLAYVPAAIAVWLGLSYAGVHPTMAGVALGLLTPPQRGWGAPAEAVDEPSPSERLQMMLHPWVAFVVMPLFALANAGVSLDWSAADARIAGGIVVGLVVGKPIGVLVGAWLAVRVRLARLPDGIGWREVTIVGLVAGVGFTVALFIATLALVDPADLASAKLGILIGSATAIGLAIIVGRMSLRRVAS